MNQNENDIKTSKNPMKSKDNINTYKKEEPNSQTIYKNEEINTQTGFNKKFKTILLIAIPACILIAIVIIIVCVVVSKKENIHKEIINEYYITGTYNAKKDVPLKLFNPSRIGLNDQNYTVEEIGKNNNTRRLQQLDVTDGVIFPEITGTIQIKISFNESLTTLDFMFEGCTDLVKISLSNLNSPSITSMIYTFTDCTSLETVDFTSFYSSLVEKMDFLFGGCTNLVNLKGFENLDTSSLQKTAGMFLECTNLISVNLSAFQLNNISEQNGMFIQNPSLEKVDLGNTSDINALFSSTENFKVTIITSSNEVNSSGLSGEFTRISREEDQQLNCTLRNWTEFLLKYTNDSEFTTEYNSDYVNNIYDNIYYSQDIYHLLFEYNYCNSLDNNSIYNNSSECKEENRMIIDFLNEFEKCTECDDKEGRRKYCKSCRKGYYVPKGIDYNPIKCKRCDEGCIYCVSDNETDQSVCLRCEGNSIDKDNDDYDNYDDYDVYNIHGYKYKLYNGKCIKQCYIGKEENCKSCNPEEGKNDQCLTCNDGYYFDLNDNKSKCKKIDIEHCTQAVIESDSVRCINCTNGYILHNGQCEKACDFGYWENTCASCNQTYEFRENCASCHTGYYLSSSYENKTICRYCNEGSSSNNCKECEYISGEVKCTECESDSFLVDGKCITSCSWACSYCIYENEKYVCNKCQDHYFLQDLGEGKICEECSEGCKTCTSESCSQCMEEYKLIGDNCEKYCTIGSNLKCKTCDFNVKNKCKDCNPGYYLPNDDILDKSKCYSCGSNCMSCYGNSNNHICTQCYYGYRLSNGECIKQCDLGYYDYCKTCDTVIPENCGSCNDGYYLPIYYKRYCNYCGSYRIKKCHQNSDYNIIIDECYYDYILIRNSCVEKCDSTNYWSNCLVCNEEPDKLDQCKQCKNGYYLPIEFGDYYCYSCPYNCKSCEGSYYNPTCTECYDGYQLSGGKCLTECNIGNNELCKSCNPEPGKIDRCLECNEYYYLPDNNYYYDYYYYYYDYNNQNQCLSCPNYCKKCIGNEYNADCTECDTGYYLVQNEENEYYYYYNPTYYYSCKECEMPGCISYKPNSNTCICNECVVGSDPIRNNIDNELISCYKGCDIGELEKCKSCSDEEGKCGECNDGFTLNTEGKCIGDFHMFAKYRTTSKNEYVELMSYTTIIKMAINGTFIDNPTYYYTFALPGEHSIYVKFSSYVSFMDLFYGITHLTYIEFLPKAKNFKINYMNDCFCGCTNLEYADLSNLNLENNRCFMNFFKGDKKLKEVKFPVEPFSNIYWYYRMFYGCESLTSIDMSNIHNTNGEYFYEMFYGCTKLRSIDLGGFNKAYDGYYKYDIFVNVPKDAVITIHNNFYRSISGQLTDFPNKIVNN